MKVIAISLLLALLGGANAFFKPNIPRLGLLSFMELCEEFNQTCQEHEVITEDGYIITLHRIIGENIGKGTILGWHGMFLSSDALILKGLNSTAVSLAEDGYDVWLGNSRGNKYSRRHVSMDPDEDEKYWAFSFHEMGVFDMAASIDYILEVTGKKQISAFGHSQGTTMFYALASTMPIYNEKVNLFISMAPVAFFTDSRSNRLTPLWFPIEQGLKLLGVHELFKNNSIESQFVKTFCTFGDIGYKTCGGNVLGGEDWEELDPEFFKVIFGHHPTSSSLRVVTHQNQMRVKRRFAPFDYGLIRNLVTYGRFSPPDYDLKKNTAAVVLLGSRNDKWSTLKDIDVLRQQLPNVKEFKIMDRPQFNHIDWIWSTNINVFVNPVIKQMLNDYA